MSLDQWRRDRLARAERLGEVVALTGPRSIATPKETPMIDLNAAMDAALDKFDAAKAIADQCAENATRVLAETGDVPPSLLDALKSSRADADAWREIYEAAARRLVADIDGRAGA